MPSTGSGSVSLGVPLGEGPKSSARAVSAPRPKGLRGKLTHYPAIGRSVAPCESPYTIPYNDGSEHARPSRWSGCRFAPAGPAGRSQMPPRELTDDYRLEKILASSRGGSILRASRIDNGQTVVIKLINVPGAADPAAALKATPRFSAYPARLAALRHPNLPLVLDSGLTPDGGAFLVMEMVDGVGFDAACAPGGGGGAPDRILPLLAQALAGLEEL